MVISKLKISSTNSPVKMNSLSQWSVQRKIEKYISNSLNNLKNQGFEQYIGAWNNSAYMDELFQKASTEISNQWNIYPDICIAAKEQIRGKYYIAMSGF